MAPVEEVCARHRRRETHHLDSVKDQDISGFHLYHMAARAGLLAAKLLRAGKGISLLPIVPLLALLAVDCLVDPMLPLATPAPVAHFLSDQDGAS